MYFVSGRIYKKMKRLVGAKNIDILTRVYFLLVLLP